MELHEVKILRKTQLAENEWRFDFDAPALCAEAVPGQFVMVECSKGPTPFLRRAISINQCRDGVLSLMFAVVGEGTEALAAMDEGETVSLLGPLGRGFDLDIEGKDVVMIGGGIGKAPFEYLADALLARNNRLTFIVGGRSAAQLGGLEAYTGKKWSDERFKEVMEISGRASRAWIEATSQAKYVPSPFNGFDLLNHMAVMVTARGKTEAAEAMEVLLKEYKENHEKGVSTFRAEEKYRIMFEGIACWPWLRVTSTGLKSRGINMVTTIYADAFGYIYNDFDEMCRVYAEVPNSMNLEHARDKRIKLCKDNHVEGLLVHTNRSCKLWSGFMPEMSRQIGEACGIPVVSFDGDQADPRNFSEAQYDTRVQGLMEIMEANKGGN